MRLETEETVAIKSLDVVSKARVVITGELLRELILDPTRDYQLQNMRKPPNPFDA
ncbi:hypothetical protein ACQPYK_38350 [Streptosporangium sp. CA-135522]|uniref:hypothetical protein n=1 Tax=Streptosporangium sp. CA-135522 TaxID=3240072 RepID=UPI003D94F538